MRKVIFGIVSFALLTAWPVWAGEALVGYYEDGTGASVKVYVGDNGKARIDLDDDVYFLLEGDRVWTVSFQEGTWTVSDFVALTQAALLNDPSLLSQFTDVNIRNTGYTRSVAGIMGEIFEVTVNNTNAKYTVTVARDKNAARLSRVVMTLFRDMTLQQGYRDIMENLNRQFKSNYGILSLDTELVLLGMARQVVDEDYFALPAEITKAE